MLYQGHLDYLCPLLSISIITTLAQNSFVTHLHHSHGLLTPCRCTHFTSKLQPEGSLLKANVIVSSLPLLKISTKTKVHSTAYETYKVRLPLLSSPPYPTPPRSLRSHHTGLFLIPLISRYSSTTGLCTCYSLSRMFFPLTLQTLTQLSLPQGSPP